MHPGRGDRTIIATWLIADSASDASSFPQAGLDSSSSKFQAVYWRCVACFFATSMRIGNDARHILFTNVDRLPQIDGVSIADFLEHLGVEVRTLPITHRLGKEKVAIWNNQFYILDILSDLHDRYEFDRVAILDSDCVWVRNAEEFAADITRRGILTLCIPYASDFKVNKGSRQDLRRAALQLAEKSLTRVPYYAGGELFAATSENVARVTGLARRMWERLEASPPGEISIYEEGHFLSIIYELLDIPIGTADPHIRRMWTALRLYNVTWEDIHSSRCIWHLPMEKKTGFVALFAVIRDPNSWFWRVPPDELRPRIAATMGMPRPSVRQWLSKFRSRALDHLTIWRTELMRRASN